MDPRRQVGPIATSLFSDDNKRFVVGNLALGRKARLVGSDEIIS